MYFTLDNYVLLAYGFSDNYFVYALDFAQGKGYGWESKSLPSNKAYALDVNGASDQYVLVAGTINDMFSITLYTRTAAQLSAKRSYELLPILFTPYSHTLIDFSSRQATNLVTATCLIDNLVFDTSVILFDISASSYNQISTAKNIKLINQDCQNIEAWNMTHVYMFVTDQDTIESLPCFGVIHVDSLKFQRKCLHQFVGDPQFKFIYASISSFDTFANTNGYFVGQATQYGTYSFGGKVQSYTMTVNRQFTATTLNDPINQTLNDDGIDINNDNDMFDLQQMSWFGLTVPNPSFSHMGYLPNVFTVIWPEPKNNRALVAVMPPVQNMTYYLGSNAITQLIEPASLSQCTDAALALSYQQTPFSVLTSNSTIWNLTIYSTTASVGTDRIPMMQSSSSGQIFLRTIFVTILAQASSPCASVTYTPAINASTVINYYESYTKVVSSFPILSLTPNTCTYSVSIEENAVNGLDSTVITQFSDRIEVYTTDPGKVGMYYFSLIYTFKDSSLKSFTNYTLNVLNRCKRSTIHSIVLADMYYDVYSNLQVSQTTTGWTQSNPAECPALTYAIISNTGADVTYTQTLFTFDNSTMTFKISTTNASFIGTQVYYLRGQLKNSTQTYNYEDKKITFYIFGNCGGQILESNGQVDDQTYMIGDPAMLIEFEGFTPTQPYCGDPTYSVQVFSDSDEEILEANFINGMDLVNLQFYAESQDILDSGTYTIKINAQLKSGVQNSYTFVLEIMNPCADSLLTHSDMQTLQYDMQENQISYTIDPFTIDPNPSNLCGTVTMSITNSALQPSMEFNGTHLTVNANQDYTLCQTESDLTLRGVMDKQSHVVSSIPFKIFYDCGCDKLVLNNQTTTTPYEVEYTLGEEYFQFQFLQFIPSSQLCLTDPISYSVIVTESSDATSLQSLLYVDLDTSQADSPYYLLFVSQTLDVDLVGVHRIIIHGVSFLGLTIVQGELNVNLSIVRSCNQALVTQKPNITGQVINYKVGDPMKVIKYSQWVIQQQNCGSFTNHQLTMINIDLTNSIQASQFITIDEAQNQISIYTDNKSIGGSFQFALDGTLNQFISDRATFTVIVTNCQTYQVLAPSQKSLYYYTIGDEQSLIIPLLPFTVKDDCGLPITYAMKVTSDRGISSSDFINYLSDYNSIEVNPTDTSQYGVYYIKFSATVTPDNITYISDTLKFKVIINSPKNTAPYFVSSLTDTIEISYDSSFIYTLPEVKDKENDQVLISITNNPSFVKVNERSIVIAPQNIEDVGNYTMQVLLQDLNDNDKQQTNYDLQISITDSKTESQQINSPAGTYLQMTEYEFQLENLKIKKAKLKNDLTAQISSISQNGEISIKFNKQLISISNTDTLVNLQAIKFILQKNDGTSQYLNVNQNTTSNKRNLVSDNQTKYKSNTNNWKISKFEGDTVNIKIKFPEPLEVSTHPTYDLMDVRFSERYFFVSEDQSSVLTSNYVIQNDVPPQLPDTTATKALNTMTESTSTAMTGIVTINVILSLVMGLSLKKLWLLIQTLQVIVHLPLLQVPLPSNVISAYKNIIDVSNLNIIPKEYIKKILSVFIFCLNTFMQKVQMVKISLSIINLVGKRCDYPFIQAFIQVQSSILLIIYVTYFKPYKKKSDYIFEIFNEFTLLTISYFLIVFIEIVSDYQLRYDIGWYVVVVTLFNIFTNWISMAFTVVLTIKEKIREKCKKKQQANFDNKVQKYNYDELDQELGSTLNVKLQDGLKISTDFSNIKESSTNPQGPQDPISYLNQTQCGLIFNNDSSSPQNDKKQKRRKRLKKLKQPRKIQNDSTIDNKKVIQQEINLQEIDLQNTKVPQEKIIDFYEEEEQTIRETFPSSPVKQSVPFKVNDYYQQKMNIWQYLSKKGKNSINSSELKRSQIKEQNEKKSL
eukprot:403376025